MVDDLSTDNVRNLKHVKGHSRFLFVKDDIKFYKLESYDSDFVLNFTVYPRRMITLRIVLKLC